MQADGVRGAIVVDDGIVRDELAVLGKRFLSPRPLSCRMWPIMMTSAQARGA